MAFLGVVNTLADHRISVAVLLLAAGLVAVAWAPLFRLIARNPSVRGDARRWALPADCYELIVAVVDARRPVRRAVCIAAPVRGPPTSIPPSDPAAAFR